MLQKPCVRAETDHRPHDREVRPRRDRSRLERVRAELRCLAGDEPRADEHEPAAEHLVDGRDERVAGKRQPARDERAARPGERCREHHEQTDRDRSAADAAGADDEREADQADPGSQHRRAWDALARERAPDDDLQRHGACDHRCDAGVDPRLGHVHQADPAREQRDAQTRRRERFAAVDAKRSPRDCEDRGEDRRRSEEARSGREERRQCAHGELDPEVGRSPDEVDDPERRPELDLPAAHVEWNSRRRLGVRSPADVARGASI